MASTAPVTHLHSTRDAGLSSAPDGQLVPGYFRSRRLAKRFSATRLKAKTPSAAAANWHSP
ncbi:hypothetical protein RRG08_001141, partial [Elysia crispata]